MHPVSALDVFESGTGPLARGTGLTRLQHDGGHAVGLGGGALLAHRPAKARGTGPAVVLAEKVGGGLAAVLQEDEAGERSVRTPEAAAAGLQPQVGVVAGLGERDAKHMCSAAPDPRCLPCQR